MLTASVVIAAVSGDSAIRGCLASIHRAAAGLNPEIIVMRGQAASVFELRRQGMMRASGDRVAVVGDRYEVTPGWLTSALATGEFDVTGGSVAPAVHLSYWGWCVYLTEYAHVSPPAADGPTHQPKLVPGGNVVYVASLLRRAPPAINGTDLSFHQRVLNEGASLGILSDLEVCFAHPPAFLEYVGERFWFARKIAAACGLRKSLLAPLLPFVILIRTAAGILPKKRFIWRFIACAPAIFLLGFVQAAGELTGSVARSEH